MFDERSLQLVSSYVKAEETLINNSKMIWQEGIVPLVKAIAERLDYEWDRQARIELGQETYVMTPDEFGGWKWEKVDPLSEEYEDVESDLWADAPTRSLSPGNAQKMLVGSSDLEKEEETLKTVVNSPPDHIEEEHWQEIVEGSAIDPDIASRNFKSLQHDSVEQANEAWEYLMYSNKISRRNDGRLRDGDLNRYQHLEKGGWWCNAGVDPRSFSDLQPGDKPDEKLWGCFKPNEPRAKRDDYGQIIEGKFIKYEHPPKTDLSIFLLDVPDHIAERIYDKAGVNPTESDRASGFWYCVWKHDVPVTITEGAKKAASILSQGEAAIGLPGIYAGYRSKDEQGNEIPPKLHPELAVFATKDREINFCFDYETRPQTVRNIEISTLRTAGLLEEAGAKVSVIRLPGPEKGMDDFIVNNGTKEFESLVSQAESLEEWHRKNQKIWDVKPIKQKLNAEQLDNITNKLVNNAPGDHIDPEDFRLTIFLKDGAERKLYEQKDGVVATNVVRENLTDEEILKLGKPRKKLVQEESSISGDIIPVQYSSVSPEISLESTKPRKYWAKQKDVPVFKKTIPRRFVEGAENKYIALAAKELLSSYGVEHDDGSLIYRSDAFTIRKSHDIYSIHRHADEQASYFANPLMQFQVNSLDKVNIVKKPNQMLSVERQEFLLIADYLTHGKKLPSLDMDTRKLANSLSSLAPKGTQASLESVRNGEIIKVMHGILSHAKSDEVEIDNYRIKSERNTSTGKAYLRLFKLEENSQETEKIRFELTKTPQSVSNQVRIMALNDFDLDKLKQIAKKLNIETSTQHKASSSSPTNNHSPSSTNNYKNSTSPTSNRNIPLPLHPELTKVWHKLEESVGWTSAANQGNNDLREKLQHEDKLTLGEQRELYFKLLVQTKDEQLLRGKTDIILPPISAITKDLEGTLEKSIGSTPPHSSTRDILLPLHPELANAWHKLEESVGWTSAANQGNNDLREKLQHEDKLTLGEQRELYFKLLLQTKDEQLLRGKTDIILPPISTITKDLLKMRRESIDSTYTPIQKRSLEVKQQHNQVKSEIEYE
ncbi:DUF3854 domain-containing protein [Nostocales cyanobacterium LEGE 11386]|nr:DUF3854 domain-containing protein [Nostocales cyanobacterium LEGE 11386]